MRRMLFSLLLTFGPLAAGAAPGVANGISRSTAFTEYPYLQAVCEQIVTDPGRCTDVPLFRGPEIDELLNRYGNRFGWKEVPSATFEFEREEIDRLEQLLLQSPATANDPWLSFIRRLRTAAIHGLSLNNPILLRSDLKNSAGVVAYRYAIALEDRSWSAIRSEFLASRPPIMTRELVARAREEEMNRPTVLGECEKERPGVMHDVWEIDVKRYAHPSVEFACGFEILAFRINHPDRTFEDFLRAKLLERPMSAIKALASMREVAPEARLLDQWPLAMRWYYQKIWDKVSWSPSLGQGSSVSHSVHPPSQAPKKPLRGLTRTSAFADSPWLKEVCQRVVTDRSLCVDAPVFRSRDIDTLLNTLHDAGDKYYTDGITLAGQFSAHCGVTFGFLTLSGLNHADENYRVLKSLADQGISFDWAIFLRSGRSAPASTIAHEYAHLIFRNDPDKIRAEYLPLEAGALSELWSLSEQFAYGFQILAFRVNHPEQSLNDFVTRENRLTDKRSMLLYRFLWQRMSLNLSLPFGEGEWL